MLDACGPKLGRLLGMGCGSGRFLALAAERGAELPVGLEIRRSRLGRTDTYLDFVVPSDVGARQGKEVTFRGATHT